MYKLKFLVCLLISFSSALCNFNYDLHVTTISGNSGKTTLCLHGMGGDYRIGEILKHCSPLEDTLVSFNFPDHNLNTAKYDPDKTSFGTVYELLPPLSLLKKLIIDESRSSLNLYGFSAGGGAIINVLVALNTEKHDKILKKIGIHEGEKKKILEALQKGKIILDTPLKSVAEIIAFRGPQEGLVQIGKRFKKNDMEPIESIRYLKNLAMHFIVHFQAPDEVLSNRDDRLFIERLTAANPRGITEAIIGTDTGHMLPHPSLWRYLNP